MPWEEALARRLRLFNESTLEVIKHYRDLGLVFDIDGTLDIDAVYARILNELYRLATTDDTVDNA